ncbi:hypothetical protein BBJ28_00007090 [Nothophytophthora sp. Chile5]|nr:hypothetical protein BBJ28_00007090 [Nothophytophthora sp. Chile5]
MLWRPYRLTLFFAEILVLGCGPRISHALDPELKELLKVNGIVVEYLDTVNACATFNILNAEDRKVAAALLPYDPDAAPDAPDSSS